MRTWMPPLCLCAAAAVLSWWLWGHTGEMLLDFGAQLYQGWQVSQGRVLFRDVQCMFGPLSPEVAGLAMRLFGPGLQTALWLNFIVLLATTIALYFLLRSFCDGLTATAAGLFFLTVFGLTATTLTTNYNFLTPYAFQITQGLLLCLGVVACAGGLLGRRAVGWAAMGGLFCGLAFLTKPEMFVGAAAALGAGLVASIWLGGGKRRWPLAPAAAAGAALPPLAALAWFAGEMPFAQALNGVLGGWQFVSAPYVVNAPFYRKCLGTDHTPQNLLRLFCVAGIYLLLAAALAGLARLGARLASGRKTIEIAAGSALALLILAALWWQANAYLLWLDLASGLPLFAAAALALAARELHKTRELRAAASGAMVRFCFTALAAALLLKMILNCRFYNYGFVLGAPCGMLAVVALLYDLPRWAARHGCSAVVLRCAAAGVVAGVALHSLLITSTIRQGKTRDVQLALGGQIWMWPRQEAPIDAAAWLSGQPNVTAAVFPDSAGLLYMAGVNSSVPYFVFHPNAMDMAGEPRIIAAFAARPPTYILVMDLEESDFGASYFGRDYGLNLAHWIEGHYHPILAFNGPERRIVVWRWNDAGAKKEPPP